MKLRPLLPLILVTLNLNAQQQTSSAARQFEQSDINKDGKLTREELPERFRALRRPDRKSTRLNSSHT